MNEEIGLFTVYHSRRTAQRKLATAWRYRTGDRQKPMKQQVSMVGLP
jgi:hypothetical protein